MSKKVGPGNPPHKNRFQKGKSGNPKGRPKKAADKSRSPFDAILDEIVIAKLGGIERELTVEEVIDQQTLKKAFDRDQSARREVMNWIKKRDKVREKLAQPTAGANRLHLEGPDPDNVEDALLLLGIVTPEPSLDLAGSGVGYLLIETWAAQKAISRHRKLRNLSESDISLVTSQVRDPDSLRWPRSVSNDQ